MNENDTFLRLKRSSLNELETAINKTHAGLKINESWLPVYCMLLLENGWTHKEYIDALAARNNDI